MISNIRYFLLIATFLALFSLANETTIVYGAIYSPAARTFGAKAIDDTPKLSIINVPQAENQEIVEIANLYSYVPEENLYSDEWVNPPRLLRWQMKRIVSWNGIIDTVLDKYPHATNMLVLGIIAQETQGIANLECNDFDTRRDTCAVGVMGILPGRCGLSASQLENPTKNIDCGTRMINQIYEQALDKGFEPGRDAIRASLGAYNCGWKSLLTNNCYSFGGFAYADKVLNYWTPLIENYLER